jgi:lipoprotein-anchoring transpeptidase ErfK/SrfK
MATGGYRLTAVTALLIVAGTTVAGWHHPQRQVVLVPTPTATASTSSAAAASASAAAAGVPAKSATGLTLTLPSARVTQDVVATPATLTPAARKFCPVKATACVDLEDHLTWLQSNGHITYGPVVFEPGTAGTSRATPRGTFHVQWKAGANYVSIKYHEPMPWAVFFAPGGVAFHGGSLTAPSHGCVHLTVSNARYYHDHLPIGAEVAVF